MNDIDQFTSKELCNFTGKLQGNEKILCVGGSPSELFIGTNQGRIIHIKNESNIYKVKGILELPQKSPITQIEDASAVEIILLVCDETLFELHKETFQFVGQHLNVLKFALNLSPDEDDPFTLQLACAHPNNRIEVCKLKNGKLETAQKISTPDQVVELVYNKNAISYATNSSYYVCNLETRGNLQLFPFDDRTVPSICKVDANEFLFNGMDGLAVYVDCKGISTRPPMMLEKGCSNLECKGDTIFALINATIHIVSSETMKTIQLIEIESAEDISILDGCLFVIAKEKLYQISSVEFESIIKSLLNEKSDYQKVVDMFEQKDIETLSDSELSHLFEAKRKLAFKYLEDKAYGKAEEIFDDLNIDPLIVITELEQSGSVDSNVEFLCGYLQKYRIQHGSTAELDQALFKLLLSRGRISDILGLGSLNLQDEDIQKLVDKGYFYAASCLYWDTKDKKNTIELWKELLGKSKDDKMLDVKEIFKRVKLETNQEILCEILPSLVSHDVDTVVQIVTQRKLPPSGVSKFLKNYKTPYCNYLESWRPASEVQEELAELYLEDIKEGKNDARQKLRKILLDCDDRVVQSIKDKFPNVKTFAIEHQLISARNNPDEAFEKIVNEFKDYDTAEMLCVKYSKLVIKLLDAYLKSDKQEHMPRMLNLLENVSGQVDAQEIIQKLPQHIELPKVENFLIKAMHNKLSEDTTNTLKEQFIEIALKNRNQVGSRPPVRIDENSQCPVCRETLSFESSLTCLKTGYVVHTSCVKNPHICPVTGK